MGRPLAGDGFLIDLFRTLEAVAEEVAFVVAIVAVGYTVGLACRFVFAQASSVQTHADVGHGKVNQW